MTALVSAVGRLLGLLDRAVAIGAGAVLLAITLLLIVNAAGRSVGLSALSGGPTLAGLLILWLTFVGAYVPARRKSHIAVDVLHGRLGRRTSLAVRVSIAVVAAVLCTAVARLGWTFTSFRFASGQVDQMLFIPTGWFYAPLPVGFALCALAWTYDAADAIWGQD